MKRWVATHINEEGFRIHSRARQGRNTFLSKGACQDWINCVFNSDVNTPQTLKQCFGENPRPEPRLVACYETGDPKGESFYENIN